MHYATFHHALSLVAHHCPHGQTRHQTRLPTLPGEPRATRHSLTGQLAPCPFFFNHLADAFEWLLKNSYHIQDLMHEMDSYFTVGSPNSSMCPHNVETIPDVTSQVGIPLTPDKLVVSTTRLLFLSIITFLAESQFLPPISNINSINIGVKRTLYYTETIPKDSCVLST